MLAFLKKNQQQCRTILVEKTDRLYRNIRDYVAVDESGVTIHFVKEGCIISPDSRSSEQFIHGIKVLMARNYSENLGEETLKGMLQKARSGLYPSCAPAGYRNVEGSDNKRTIVPDSDAPIITQLFQVFAKGKYSLKALAAKARAEGWMIRGRYLQKSTLHQILRRRIYSSDFDWDGVAYKGNHQALVSLETWQAVQALLDNRVKTKQHRIKRDFAFTGLVRCGHCGCALVGELKKGKYVYYHCTGHRGKCPEPYTREELLQDQFGALLRELVIPPGVLNWLQVAVAEFDLNERGARDRELKRLEEQHRRVQAKLEAIYEDRLEGRISKDLYDRKSQELRTQSLELLGRINEMRASAPAPVEDAINLMDLTSRSAELFPMQPAPEQQHFLKLLLKAATWQDGRLCTEFENPFESLRRSNQSSRTKHAANGSASGEMEDWLLR